jgi:hypothetical protein
MSVQNILIDGTALFQDNTENAGVVETGLFDGSAVNTGTTTTAAFSGTAANHGTVVEEATFSDSAVNTGTVAVAAFVGSASNAGTVTEAASFADTTTNSGVISGTATFSGSAENDGGTVAGAAVFADTATNTGIVSGAVVFTGDAVNNGTVAEAIFLGNSQNGGTVTLSATFAENAGNLGTGLVQGNAVFADNTVNAGTIQGNAEIAATANGEQGDVAGSVTTYTQPDGAFAYGYFSGGSKTAPASYATVVYQVGSFWYKYDASGNGAFASGNYSDGTSMFTFANGVKGAAYVPGYSTISLGGSDYYYTGSFANGTVLYTDTALTTTSNGQIWLVDVNNDGIEEYVTTASAGVLHITYKPSYDLQYVGGNYTYASSYLLPDGSTSSQLPGSNDTVLVTSSMNVNEDGTNSLDVDSIILWGGSSVEFYASNGGSMVGNVKAYGETRIRNIDIYGVVEMFDNSHVGDAVLHGATLFDNNATNNGNITGNPARIFLTNGLYSENGSLYTGTKTYGGDGYGLANSTFEYVNGVEVSRSI